MLIVFFVIQEAMKKESVVVVAVNESGVEQNLLQEVVRSPSRDMRFSSSWSRIKLKERVLKVVIQFHDRSLIPTSIAIVWCRKNGNHLSIVTPVVSFHHQLMSSSNESQAIGMIKGL